MNADYILLLTVYFSINEYNGSREVRSTRLKTWNKKPRIARANPTEICLFKTQKVHRLSATLLNARRMS